MPITLPNRSGRPDYYFLNDKALKVLAGGYVPPNTPKDKDSVRAAAIARLDAMIDGAEEILGRALPTLRLGFRRGWVSPSSPVWSNFRSGRGLPISCNGSVMDDTVDSIVYKVAEIGFMSKEGAGTSVYMGHLRPMGAPISVGGESEGPVRFAELVQTQVAIISQANVRRGNCAIWSDVEREDIGEWLKMRSTTGSVHHPIQHLSFGVVIGDQWMEEMLAEDRGGEKRKIMAQIANKRRQTGYPYIMFRDNANNVRHDRLKELDLLIRASNLCTEIMLPSTPTESFVCNLSSLNLLWYDEWKHTNLAAELVYFLDAVLTEYIEKCRMEGRRLLADALRFAERWRALGIGTLGYHSYLQWNMIPFRSAEARRLNVEMHKLIHEQTIAASRQMAIEYGEPEGMKGTGQRHLTLQAIAPTRSSSLILGQVSKGIEPWEANIFEDDNAKSVLVMRNEALEALLDAKGLNNAQVWDSILSAGGSVQGLPDSILDAHEKAVFETFLEIGPDEIIEQNNDRTPFVDQGISLNLKIDPEASLKQNVDWIVKAWRGGSKSLYYHEGLNKAQELARKNAECLACQA